MTEVIEKPRAEDRRSKPANPFKPPGSVSNSVQLALREAMRLEAVPTAEFDDLVWIVAQESGGTVGVRDRKSTARGLFQLLRAQYRLNPHAEQSFGNAVEECQGGIRYVRGRYRSAKAARAFWERHRWY